jgi:hypothetical protein
MIISKSIEVVFVAIPKTGTRSVYEVLINDFGGHMLREHGIKIPNEYSGYYSFTIVRNPYDRLVSAWWSTTQRGHDKYNYKKELGNNMSFLNFCKNLEKYEGKFVQHTAPQSRWLDNKLDKIIKYENLNEEWLNLPFNRNRLALPHNNPTVSASKKNPVARKVYTDYLNNEILPMINKYYHEDFEKTGYQKIESIC